MPWALRQHLQTLYKEQVAELLNRQRQGQVVLDVGGGKNCTFLPDLGEPAAHLIIALDCSEEELRRNHYLDGRIVCDAALKTGFPIRDQSADFVVSRSVVEHIPDNQAFFTNCARVLRPGGTMIHAFPAKFAPFALINQVLPNWFVRRLIPYLLPHWVDSENYGFVAFYDRCYYSAVNKMLRRSGLHKPIYVFTHYQSPYFVSFFPLFCLSVAYDFLNRIVGIRNLASGILVIAERPAEGSDGPGGPSYDAIVAHRTPDHRG